MNTLLNDLSITDVFLFILICLNFISLIFQLISVFRPSEMFMKDGSELVNRYNRKGRL